AQVRLGVRTTTGDAEGEVLETREVAIDEAALRRAVDAHTGDIEQIPPMHSALKHAGKPLYEYARAGETIERAVRHVRIHEIELLDVTLPS
ncbi:tRNA pseudouridine(55) synthase TruB, partial [Acinetobacter baumannii]